MSRYLRSKDIKSKRNHIVVTAVAESEGMQEAIELEIRKATRKLKRMADGNLTFEMMVISPDRNQREVEQTRPLQNPQSKIRL